MFSGQYDKLLPRDGSSRILLDINPTCFQAIVDYLNEMSISSTDDPPDPPSVAHEFQYILLHQVELFGFSDIVPITLLPRNSSIVKDENHATKLHE